MQRFQELAAAKQKDTQAAIEDKEQKDFLDLFIGLKYTHGDIIDDNNIIGYMLINMLAGSDTTAITLRAILYYLFKNPAALGKLLAELEAANLQEPIEYRKTEHLPYFSAVVREAMRLHPGVGLVLERIVPSGGLTLNTGEVVPPGTIVGLNPWVIHRNADVFGADVESFIPERWLPRDGESSEEFEARVKPMRESDLTFGAGSRVCIGRWLAIMEVYKIIPTILLRYDVSALPIYCILALS